MKRKDQIPLHSMLRVGQRIWMIDTRVDKKDQVDFLKSIVDEWDEEYRRLWIPDNQINLVRSMPSRVREFFWWKIGLRVIQAYRRGDEGEFHNILNEFFHASNDQYSMMSIEAVIEQIRTNKGVPQNSNSLSQLIKKSVENLRTNPHWISEINNWLRNASYHFYELWKDRKIPFMTWLQILEEFKKI